MTLTFKQMFPTQHLNLVLIHKQTTSGVDAIALLGIGDFEITHSEPYYKIPDTTRTQYRLWTKEPKVDARIAKTIAAIRSIGCTGDWHLIGPKCDTPHIQFCAILDNRKTPVVAKELVWIHFENVPENES